MSGAMLTLHDDGQGSLDVRERAHRYQDTEDIHRAARAA